MTDAAGAVPAGLVSLVVTVDTDRAVSDQDNGLGAIRFGNDGEPEPNVTMYYRALVAVVTAANSHGGLELKMLPAAMRDQVIARALGRTLAHEIGHFVLRSPRHARSGLMQARQHAASLADPSRQGFTLNGDEQMRLKALLVTPVAPPTRGSGLAP